MTQKDLQRFLGHHCRFRFRGGKLVYGVIWESKEGLVFASKDQHEAYLSEGQVELKTDLMTVKLDDVMAAELID